MVFGREASLLRVLMAVALIGWVLSIGEILRAVVKVQATVPKDARTANILGTGGHVLTIGYHFRGQYHRGHG
jgi:hypothetical protein